MEESEWELGPMRKWGTRLGDIPYAYFSPESKPTLEHREPITLKTIGKPKKPLP